MPCMLYNCDGFKSQSNYYCYNVWIYSKYDFKIPARLSSDRMCGESVYRQLSLLFGVMPLLIQKEDDTEKLFSAAVKASIDAGIIAPGDKVVITAGVPLGIAGTTNMIRVVEV